MLTKIEARSPSGDLLSLPLDDISGGFVVADVQGLGPIKATIVTSAIATMPGAHIQNTRREPRNILLSLELAPDYTSDTVRDLRFRLYDFFMPEASVNLRFVHEVGDSFEVEINGVVEDNQDEIFTKEPTAEISIICASPDFTVLEDVVFEGDTVDDLTEALIAYPGTVSTGAVVTMTLVQDIEDITIFLRGPDNITRRFSVSGNMLTGDIVEINSMPGSKGVTVTRSGTPFSLLAGVGLPPFWPVLAKGNNYIRVIADGPDPFTSIPYEVSYRPKYGGL